jgi:hypothetical protein
VVRADLERIGLENPEHLAALFLMGRDDINLLTRDTPPLTDFYPKRLSDTRPDRSAIHEFAGQYFNATAAAKRFRRSAWPSQVWGPEIRSAAEPLFAVREIRYRAITEGAGTNLAELDFLLRKTSLREPVLEVFHTDADRVAISERTAAAEPGRILPYEAVSDLLAAALARRNLGRAIELLERATSMERENRGDVLLLTYLYCLNGDVNAAEKMAMRIRLNEKDRIVTWLWGKLQAEFGFRPPG